jgi:hypothetical protein
MEKGIATGSFVTLWPAINTIFSANSGNEYFSSKIEMTYGKIGENQKVTATITYENIKR